jgi:hypothetical protein
MQRCFLTKERALSSYYLLRIADWKASGRLGLNILPSSFPLPPMLLRLLLHVMLSSVVRFHSSALQALVALH